METIEFKRNNKVRINMYRTEYDYVHSISISESKDIRVQRGIEKTFCIIKLFSLLNPFSEYVPIHCDVFKNNVSGKNYHRYRTILYKNKVIDFKESKIETYKDKKGKSIIKSSPMVFRCIIMTYQGCHSIFDDTSEIKPIEIELTSKLYKSLQTKYHVVDVQKNKRNMDLIGKKSNSILATNDSDTYVSFLLVKMIKDVVNHKINSRITWQRRIRAIAKNYQRKDTVSIKDKEIMIESLIIKIIRCLYDKKKVFEQIVDNFLSQVAVNQLKRDIKRWSNTKGQLSYYKDLSVDIEGLDYCVSLRDLSQIARINRIPKFRNDGKLYSTFSNLRREIRKYVRYKDELLIEVSDIHSAHFTMLPLIFEKCNITIPPNEMLKFKEVTQKKDLYSEVVQGTMISRDEIKPVFQSFFSIKNEKQYLFSSKSSEYQHRQMICEYFSNNFPVLYSSMIDFHNIQNDSIKSVANVVESEIMNPICDTIQKEGLHPFRLHDAIYMTEKEFNQSEVNINQMVYDTINHKNIN